ncbi:uncharacterized protein LOC116345775 isoform X2 [Contarinia nasturtii]|uniref:uncharacterized protein LOC116345775 isoform X2 n=1 Tax=Contarinia nasturtii TaxID=265458 RepID=UPI0012D4204A|nr:uncharacterized protein LOC116345775 isoform X2 [Contarinia nasturtii]
MFVFRGILFTISVAIFISPTAFAGQRCKNKGQASVPTKPDQLVEINQKDLKRLQNLYKPDGYKRYITYTTIENYIRWLKQDPNLKDVKFFCLNGDFTDGTFVVTVQLHRLLSLINYSNGCIFTGIRTDLKPVIIDALKEVNVNIALDRTSLLYYLPKEEALKFDVERLPEGIELRQIRDIHDIEKANSVWPNRNPNSLRCLQRMAKYNPQVGAYKEDGTLAAWLFSYSTGFLGPLQVDENYYGKGYAGLVTKYVAKKIAENGHDAYASIVEKNAPSRSLFTKLGFKSIGEVQRIQTESKLSITMRPPNKMSITAHGSLKNENFFPLPRVFWHASLI